MLRSSLFRFAAARLSTRQLLRQSRPLSSLSPPRTEEQRKADKLKYEGMLKMANQVLALEESSHNARDLKLALNYWTSVQAQAMMQAAAAAGHDHEETPPHYAFRIFEALMKQGVDNPTLVQEVVKTDDDGNPIGGLVYLMEHILSAFRGTHQLMTDSASTTPLVNRDDLLTALTQASGVLLTMERLQSDPEYPAILEDKITLNLAALNLWSKRVWFLNHLGADDLIDKDVAFGGHDTVEDCMIAMTSLADETRQLDNVPLMKLYNILIPTWVHSDLPETLDIVLDLLNDMEEDDRIAELSSIPYSSVLFLCAKQASEDAATIALQLWQHIRAHDSGVEPDASTLGALLSALINGNMLDEALSILNEVEGEEGTHSIKPNTVCYNVVLGGLVKSKRPDATKLAEALLQRMTVLCDTGVNTSVAPDKVTYSTVMELVSDRGGAQAEAILLRCKTEMGLEPDRVMYNIVLDSYAKQHNDLTADRQQANDSSDADRAEALLRTMENLPETSPNAISYNSVLNAMSKSNVPVQRIYKLFQEMKDRAAAGDDTVQPDSITYNIVLGAIARDGSHETLNKAEDLMKEMRENNVHQDRITFNTFMASIIKSGHNGAAELAEGIIEKMEADFAENEEGVRPDATSYNAVLNGYAKADSLQAAQHAERILRNMLDLSIREGRSDCRPDFVSYTSVIDAYARSRSPDAGFKAESLLKAMQEHEIVPNIVCYNSAINCWAKSKHVDAPLRAEGLLDRMQQHAKPNSVSFSSVMNCWAQSSLDGAADRAHAILTRMEELTNAGDRGMQPNAYTYSTVISAWGKIGRADKAMEILNRARQPNFACYNATINAIAKSRSLNKAEEAASVLARMKSDFQKTGNRYVAPTAVSYSSVLNACAYTINNEPNERAKAFQIARRTFKDLLQNVKPTSASYVTFLTACARLLPHGQHRDDMVVALYRDCEQRGLVNDRVRKSFEAAMSPRVSAHETAG